jgi:hypothetical protein
MYMRKQHKEDNLVRGSNPRWKDTFFIDEKGGEIHQMHRTEEWFKGDRWSQRCKGQRHVSRGSMSDMTLVLHDIISVLHQSVAINAKGGDC